MVNQYARILERDSPHVALDYRPMAKCLRSCLEKEEARKDFFVPGPTRLEATLDAEWGESSPAARLRIGHRKAAKLLWLLDRMGIVRSNSQKEAHWRNFIATLPLIYGLAVFEANEVEILERWGIDKVVFEVYIVAPRRFGKSFLTGNFEAALLLVCSGGNQPFDISNFSAGGRQTLALKNIVENMMKKSPHFYDEYVIISNSGELLQIAPRNNQNDLRRAYFYPSTKKLKGVNAHVVVLEEAALLDMAVFFEVIVPLFGMKGVAVLGISTPRGTQNFFYELITLKDEEGNLLFNVFYIELICEDCKRKPGNESKTECIHKMHLLPPWKTLARQKLLMKIMESRPELYLQENLAMMLNNNNEVFSAELLAFLKDAVKPENRYVSSDTFVVRHWFIAVDPTGGGNSKLAMIAGFWGPRSQLVE